MLKGNKKINIKYIPSFHRKIAYIHSNNTQGIKLKIIIIKYRIRHLFLSLSSIGVGESPFKLAG
jgi:hypothetical protein